MAESEYNKQAWRKEDIARIKQLITEGIQVQQEVDDLREGLRDTVKAIAEELGVKPAQLNRAIRIAYKQNIHEERDALNEIEDILDAAGRNN